MLSWRGPGTMSTCPRCKGHLTATHRCPRGPLVVTLEVTLAGLAGGFAGLLIAAVFDPHGRMDTVFLAGGVVIGVTLGRVLLR